MIKAKIRERKNEKEKTDKFNIFTFQDIHLFSTFNGLGKGRFFFPGKSRLKTLAIFDLFGINTSIVAIMQ